MITFSPCLLRNSESAVAHALCLKLSPGVWQSLERDNPAYRIGPVLNFNVKFFRSLPFGFVEFGTDCREP